MFSGKNIIVAGGDGFCGWPTALRLSKLGARVIILDNFSRRDIDKTLDHASLTPIHTLEDRVNYWNQSTGLCITWKEIDIASDYMQLKDIFVEHKPDTVLHFAEQRSAPYSMRDENTRRYTMSNNINSTQNLLNCIIETNKNIHFVHLGTMGVYGYGAIPNMIIPEGYVDVTMKNKDNVDCPATILYPANPGSVYHLTKTQDALMFQYYAKNWGLRITDLHQGIIWGVDTIETQSHTILQNRLDYDGDYGTVLNRFIIQAACGQALSVYGTGGQTRAFININDSIECICIAIQHPPDAAAPVCIFNQVTETHTVYDLAAMIGRITNSEIEYVPNPRKELIQNDLTVDRSTFRKLGLIPTVLSEDGILELIHVVKKYRQNVNILNMQSKAVW